MTTPLTAADLAREREHLARALRAGLYAASPETGLADWLHRFGTAFADALESPPPAHDDACEVERHLSRVCERGTAACGRIHGFSSPPPAQPAVAPSVSGANLGSVPPREHADAANPGEGLGRGVDAPRPLPSEIELAQIVLSVASNGKYRTLALASADLADRALAISRAVLALLRKDAP